MKVIVINWFPALGCTRDCSNRPDNGVVFTIDSDMPELTVSGIVYSTIEAAREAVDPFRQPDGKYYIIDLAKTCYK